MNYSITVQRIADCGSITYLIGAESQIEAELLALEKAADEEWNEKHAEYELVVNNSEILEEKMAEHLNSTKVLDKPLTWTEMAQLVDADGRFEVIVQIPFSEVIDLGDPFIEHKLGMYVCEYSNINNSDWELVGADPPNCWVKVLGFHTDTEELFCAVHSLDQKGWSTLDIERQRIRNLKL